MVNTRIPRNFHKEQLFLPWRNGLLLDLRTEFKKKQIRATLEGDSYSRDGTKECLAAGDLNIK